MEHEVVGDEKFMGCFADIPVIFNDNGLPFKNNVEYAKAKFMQDNKMTKRSIGIFFNNPDLALIWEYLSYKSVDEMRALLTKFIESDAQNATMVPLLLATNKTMLTEHIRDMAQWPVYLTIGTFSHEIQ